MAFLEKTEIKTLYKTSRDEAYVWRADYRAYERLADNDLMEGMDPNLPEVNDGSLAAALYKLPKRIVSSNLTGTVKAIDRDEAWLAELANIVWQKDIIPNANTQAPFWRKWKDAVRKAAIYGSVPIITIFVDRDGKRHADFIVGQPQDVVLEAGKVSDYDSDVIFWDIYLSELQLENMIEQAESEQKEAKDSGTDGYNKWDIPLLKKILDGKMTQERASIDSPRQEDGKNVRPKGFKFCIAVQRGVEAPFCMYHEGSKDAVREWSNPDPSGDVNIHFLYCYQDFINPYGTGIVKLAGGTQNVLDYMRQADVLATQLGLRPPIQIQGDATEVDEDSLVYAQDALWFVGDAKVVREELANGVYDGLPNRIEMYQGSLNKLIPMGDTSVSAGAGDPQQSKTPAGVKFAQANLSIDDEDFKDNLYMTFEAVAKSMINTHFANMEGSDLIKMTDKEREILMKGGLEFPQGAGGEISNQVEVVWDTVRAEFDFEVDPELDKTADDGQKLDGLTKVADFVKDPATQALVAQGPIKIGKQQLDPGELLSEIISLTTDNDKIITEISPEEEMAGSVDPATGAPVQPAPDPQAAMADQTMRHNEEKHQLDLASGQQDIINKQDKHETSLQPEVPQNPAQVAPDQAQGDPAAAAGPDPEEMSTNVAALMKQYGVDEHTALIALAAEHDGLPTEDIIAQLQKEAANGQQ